MQMDDTMTSCWMWALACLLMGSALCESNTTDYCSLCKDHIACNNSGGFAKSCPPSVKLLELNETEKQLFIHTHNGIRNKWAQSNGFVKVHACRMATITWNDELAELAKLQVQKCTAHYDKCHSTQQFPYSGQNHFYIGYWPSKPWLVTIFQQALETWDNMGFWTTARQLTAFKSGVWKSNFDVFALLVLEENMAVGCAAISFEDEEERLTSYRLTCNYASNNFEYRPVFTKCRVAGAKCETGRNSFFPGLCSVDEVYDLKSYPRKDRGYT